MVTAAASGPLREPFFPSIELLPPEPAVLEPGPDDALPLEPGPDDILPVA